jgi:hypothetical protein
MSEADAIKYSVTTVKDINTSGMAATAPKYFQTGFGRVVFTFKSFVWNSAFIIARAFHQSFQDNPTLTPEQNRDIRRIARRQLLGIYGMASAFAGVKGLPFYGFAETVAQMLNALFGDDDEPFDFDTEMREFFGELAYKGPVNFLTNLEIANRTGVAQDLIFRDDPHEVDVGPGGGIQHAAGLGGEGFEVLAAPFGVQGIEGQRGLARPADPRDHGQLTTRDGQFDVLEVVGAGSLDVDGRLQDG